MLDFELTDDFHAYPAPAKVNLFLHVVGQRDDGYHLLQTVFRLLDYADTIYIRPRTDGILHRIGSKEDLVSKIQDSLLTLQRLSGFLANVVGKDMAGKDVRARVKTLSRDVISLSDHASFQTQKITFLLDATLGMINIQQNAIIKIVSVAAVVFLPPTLVASVYGMNFDIMPELKWFFGYPFALGLMVVSAVLPFWFFRRKGWL